MMVDKETKIIPGHGPLADKSALVSYHKFLITVRDRVKAHIAAGGTREDMKPAEITQGFESLSWGFINAERFCDIMWSSMGME